MVRNPISKRGGGGDWEDGKWELFVRVVVTCQVPWPLALRYLAVVWECFIILINAALEQCTISMLRGMRRTLTNEKRRSRRGRGTHCKLERGENGDVDVKAWDNMSHSSWKICACLTKREREGENANFPCAPDTTSCKVRVCACVFVCARACVMEYKPFQLRTLLNLFSPQQYFPQFNLSKHPLSLICATLALITCDERTYILFLVSAQVTSSTVECYYSRCWEFQALF